MSNQRLNLAVQLIADGQNPFKVTLEPQNVKIKIGQTVTAGILFLAGQGGVEPYAFTPEAIGDSSASSGLSIGTDGNITGTPTHAGDFEFVGTGQDANGTLFEGTFSVHIDHGLEPDQFSPPDSEFGFATNTYQLKVKGAVGSLTFTHTTLPTGVTISSSGLLSVNTLSIANATQIVSAIVTVSDAGSGDSIDVPISFTLYKLATTTQSTFGVPVNSPIGYTTTINIFDSFNPMDGKPPYTFRLLDAGAGHPLPSWVTMPSYGVIAVTPPVDTTPAFLTVRFAWGDQITGLGIRNALFNLINPNQQLSLVHVGTGLPIAINPGETFFEYEDGSGVDVYQDSNGGTHIRIERGGGSDSNGPPSSQIFYADDVITASAGDDSIVITNRPIDQKNTTFKVMISHTLGDSSGNFTMWEEIYPQPGSIFSCTDLVIDSNGIHSTVSPPFGGGEKVRVQYFSYELMGDTTLSQAGTAQYLDQIVMPLMAHSLKRIISNWTGNLIDVTNTGGSITGSIGQDGSGNLDVAALVALAAGGDLFVNKWYDQSGNGYHLVSVGAWPPIVASGTYIGFIHFGRTTGDILTLDVAVSATPAPTGFIGKYYAGYATNPGAVCVNAETNSTWTGGQAGFIEVSLGTGTPTYQLGYSANGSPPTQNRIIGFALTPYTSCTNWTNLIDTSQSIITDAIKSFVNGSPQSTTGTINDDGIASPTIPPFQYNLGARSGNQFPSQMEITSHVIFDQDTSAHRLAIEAIII